MTGGVAAESDASAPITRNQLHSPFSFKLIKQYFDDLASHCHNNPDHLLSLPQFPRVALESPSPSGGKFWVGAAMETGVSIRWGKLGTNGTVKHIPLSRCAAYNSALELKRRILDKLDSGYDVIPHETILP